ncbi:MAG: hypothetical protein ACE5KS_06200 [Woeseiaceae bacterium]
MADELKCYRCGASLAELSLPISRQDECPSCSVYLHVCRMCEFFDPDVPKQCREDDAEEVFEKEKLNFCEWFKPGYDVFDAARAAEEAEAKDELAALFGEGESEKPADDELPSEADKLFK